MQAIRIFDAVTRSMVTVFHWASPAKTLDIVEFVRRRPSPEMVWQL
jgi:hypothetical protein